MSKKKLRRQIADLAARMEARERAGRNLVDSLDTTDADVSVLTDTVKSLADSVENLLALEKSLRSISRTHTMWLVRLSERVSKLENQSDRRDSVGQSADLRSRLCAVFDREMGYEGGDFCGHLADVVIRELGLHQEFSVGDDESGRTLWFADEEPVTPRQGEVVEHRWISQWERDE